MKLFIQEPVTKATHSLIPAEDGAPPTWIQESGKYWIVYEGDPAKGEPQLFLADAKQEWTYRDKGESLAIRWVWEPSFYAGRLSVGLQLPGEPLQAETVILHPAQHKLTVDQFNTMVQEIIDEAETCFSLSPVRRLVTLSSKRTDRPLADLEFARRYLKEIGNLLELLERSPNKLLERVTQLVPASEAEADEGTSDWIAAEGTGYLRPAEAGRSLPYRASGYILTDLQVRKNRISFDTYENRFVLQFLRELQRRLLRARQRLLDSTRDAEAPDRSLVQSRLSEVSAYVNRITRWLERSLFSGVGAPAGPHRISHVLRKHPLYSRFYQLWLRFRRSVDRLDGDLLEMPLDMTWQLYEYWAYMMVVRALRELGLVAETRGLFKVEYKTGKVAFALTRGGKGAVLLKNGHRLYFQRAYREKHKGAGPGTETGEMRPDIVLERVVSKVIQEVILLDPKYRVNESSIQAAVKDIHAYRDGIRSFPDRKPLVKMGIILAPTDASKVFTPCFGDKAGLEGIRLVPGVPETVASLKERLAFLLSDW